jgi:hypothetical protein
MSPDVELDSIIEFVTHRKTLCGFIVEFRRFRGQLAPWACSTAALRNVCPLLLHAEPADLRTVSHAGRLILSRAKSAIGAFSAMKATGLAVTSGEDSMTRSA